MTKVFNTYKNSSTIYNNI